MVAVGLGRLNENITAFSLSRDALEITPVGDGPRYLYVLSALWSIRGFFMDWNEAVSSNATGSKSDVLAILAALDPSQQTSFAVDDLYQSLMLGLPFFLAYNGSEIPLGLSLADINGLLLELVDFAVMPHSSISSPVHVTEMIQAKSIRSLLPQLAIVEGSSVQYCFQSTVSNLDTFRNVTTDGAFASSMPWYIPQDLASVAQPFYTFLVSSILAQQNWAVLALVGIEVAALSYGSSGTLPGWVLSNCPTCNPPVDFGCTTYDENSQCGR